VVLHATTTDPRMQGSTSPSPGSLRLLCVACHVPGHLDEQNLVVVRNESREDEFHVAPDSISAAGFPVQEKEIKCQHSTGSRCTVQGLEVLALAR